MCPLYFPTRPDIGKYGFLALSIKQEPHFPVPENQTF